MNKKVIILAIIVLGFALLFADRPKVLGGVPRVPSYNTASSTTYTIGHELSTKVLDTRGGRGYASFCNNTANRAYLLTGTSNVTSSSSAFRLIPAGECYEVNRDNLITGQINAIADTGSTTLKFIVSELIGS